MATSLPTSSTHGASSVELGRLQRGEISLDDYLDLKADKAVAHLRGLVSERQLRVIRDMVRENLENDPVSVALIQRATGQAPSPT